jgi:O-antigen/teichoic acid export membrane protein
MTPVSNSLVRNSILGAVGGGFVTGAGFISTVATARILGPEGAGVIAYAAWLVGIALPILDLGIISAVSRYAPELTGRGERAEAEAFSVLLFRLLVCLLVAGGALCFLIAQSPGLSLLLWKSSQSGSSDASSSSILWMMVAGWIALQGLATFYTAYLRGTGGFTLAAQLAVVGASLQIFTVLLGAMTYGLLGALLGYVIGQAPLALACLRLLRGVGRLPASVADRVLGYTVYAWAGNITTAFVWSRVEVFYLEQSWGSGSVGIFTAALAVSNLAIQGPMLLTAGLLPHFAGQVGRSEYHDLNKSFQSATRLMAFLVFPACLGGAATAPILLPAIFGAHFEAAIPAAMVLLIAAAINGPSSVATNLVQAKERTDFIFASGLLGAALSILAGLLLVPYYGAMGAAAARATVQVTMVIGGCWFVTRKLGYSLPLAALFRLLAAASVAAGAAWLVSTHFGGLVGLALAIGTGAAVYMLGVWILRALPPEDFERLFGAATRLNRRYR